MIDAQMFQRMMQAVQAAQKPVSSPLGGMPLGAPGMGNPFAAQPKTPLAGMPSPSPAMTANPQALAWLQQILGGGMGMNSGGTGSRGPAPNPFQGLNRFAGPFGNGGGAIAPNMGTMGRSRLF